MSTDDQHTIATDEGWDDVPLGDTCTVVGKLGSIAYGGQPCLLVTFSDWSQLVIHAEDVTGVPKSLMRQYVRIRCVRDEDGLMGRVLWALGDMSVPVPLTTVSAAVSGNLT